MKGLIYFCFRPHKFTVLLASSGKILSATKTAPYWYQSWLVPLTYSALPDYSQSFHEKRAASWSWNWRESTLRQCSGSIHALFSTHQAGFSKVLPTQAQATETPLPAELGVATELWKVQPDTLGEKHKLPVNQQTLGKRLFPYIASSVQDRPHRNGATMTNCLSLLPYAHTYSPTYLLKSCSYPSDKALTSIPSSQAEKNSISDNKCFIPETKLPTQEHKAGTKEWTGLYKHFDNWQFCTQ